MFEVSTSIAWAAGHNVFVGVNTEQVSLEFTMSRELTLAPAMAKIGSAWYIVPTITSKLRPSSENPWQRLLKSYALDMDHDNRQGWYRSLALGFAFLGCRIEFCKRESGVLGLGGHEESIKACGSS